MAKKKAKAAKKAPAKVKKAAKAAKKPARERIRSPKSQPLPGMEQVTNKSLNRICEHVSDVRREMNRARGEEKDLLNQAVEVMQRDKVTVYRFSGVELVLVPGDVHLRVRLLKDGANAEAPKPAAPAEEEPEAEEAVEEPEDVTDVEQDFDDSDSDEAEAD